MLLWQERKHKQVAKVIFSWLLRLHWSWGHRTRIKTRQMDITEKFIHPIHNLLCPTSKWQILRASKFLLPHTISQISLRTVHFLVPIHSRPRRVSQFWQGRKRRQVYQRNKPCLGYQTVLWFSFNSHPTQLANPFCPKSRWTGRNWTKKWRKRNLSSRRLMKDSVSPKSKSRKKSSKRKSNPKCKDYTLFCEIFPINQSHLYLLFLVPFSYH